MNDRSSIGNVGGQISDLTFLKDIFILAITAFGGPNAHIGLMTDFLVKKKKYLTESELIEYYGLCQLLPGPSSTQTITSIGYMRGGPLLAVLTLLIWAMPAVILMISLAIALQWLTAHEISLDFLRFILPVAVGFIVNAAFLIGKKVVTNRITLCILIVSAGCTVLVTEPWIFPVLILAGGFTTILIYRTPANTTRKSISPKWIWLAAFVVIFLLVEIVIRLADDRFLLLFENFYWFGSLVYGGGQVLIPMMLEQLTRHLQFLTEAQFLTGYGVVQEIPGPLFSFSAFGGAMAMQEAGTLAMIYGGFISALALFLPGTLLIFFVFPFWQQLREFSWVQRALPGLQAAAGGLVVAAVWIMFRALEPQWITTSTLVDIVVILATFALLRFTKIPAPLIVILALLAGIFYQIPG